MNLKHEKVETPLHLAVMLSCDEIYKMLIAKGKDINAKSESDMTAYIMQKTKSPTFFANTEPRRVKN